jgi:hypothetical protein
VTLILEAVARASDRYTKDYLAALEGFSPLRFSFLRSMKEILKQKSGPLARLEVSLQA